MTTLRLLDDYVGLSAATGRAISGDDHLRQSLADILSTPIGSRVMDRDYGSRVPELLDAPMSPRLVADLVASTAEAIFRWEPRVRLKRVLVNAATVAGHLTLDLVVVVRGRELKLEGVV